MSILELTCRLPVIAAVSDGASPNRALYRMHSLMNNKIVWNITHHTINIIHRHIWFFVDAPYLMKTTLNCIFHSHILFALIYFCCFIGKNKSGKILRTKLPNRFLNTLLDKGRIEPVPTSFVRSVIVCYYLFHKAVFIH